jgi:hypothetical protein
VPHRFCANATFEAAAGLIDVYATASQYASGRHGNSVKAEDVRSLPLSAFIDIGKNGAGNVA